MIAELRKRQERDLALAKERKEKLSQASLKKNYRDRRLTDLLSNVEPIAAAERDPHRLLSATKASEAAKVYAEDLDAAEQRRATIGAHGASIAMSGRDLTFIGRAKPTWMRPSN
jgi:hypothetical protein